MSTYFQGQMDGAISYFGCGIFTTSKFKTGSICPLLKRPFTPQCNVDDVRGITRENKVEWFGMRYLLGASPRL